MHTSIKWFKDQFNVNIASKEGAEEFLSIKGCRIINGNNGEFVSMPATKNQQTGKFWNHAWMNEKFAAHVLSLAQASRPTGQQEQRSARNSAPADLTDDIPF